MLLRIIAASVLCLCLLTVPAMQAFGQAVTGEEVLAGASLSPSAVRPPIRVLEPSATLLFALALGGVVALKRCRRG
jgi:hypothetical protein